MPWLLFALSGPVFWAASTHIDKYLVERYFKNSSVTVLMVFTALIGVLMLPFIGWLKPEALHLPALSIAVMAGSGLLYMGAMLFYLKALQTEEASVVAAFFQAAPLFSYALAYAILKEKLSSVQLIGGAFIICGALLLSFRPGHGFLKFRTRLVVLMLACAFVISLSSVIFKFFAVRDEFWSTTFWTYAGEALFGIVILLVPAYWQQFKALFKTNPGAVIGINGANELINLGAGLGVRYASLLAPISLVQAVSSTTTLFVFLLGILLSLFFPALGKEDLSAKNLLQKGLAALLIVFGIILIHSF